MQGEGQERDVPPRRTGKRTRITCCEVYGGLAKRCGQLLVDLTFLENG